MAEINERPVLYCGWKQKVMAGQWFLWEALLIEYDGKRNHEYACRATLYYLRLILRPPEATESQIA